MIQFISVSKIYPEKYVALDDISFEIAQGEFVFMIGPSGSGKTTIIKHLIREEKPSEGRIYFDDDDITKYKRSKVYALRRKIGVVFQDYKLIPDKNAYENVSFAMEAAGQREKDIKETVPYVLEIVGLGNRMKAFPAQLSGGEKQRVAIARAIANNPKLLIADEPTGNLDPESAWDIVQILSKINNWGTTVMMSTHGSEIVDALGKRVIKLHGGKIIKDSLKGTYKDEDIAIEKEKIKLVLPDENPFTKQAEKEEKEHKKKETKKKEEAAKLEVEAEIETKVESEAPMDKTTDEVIVEEDKKELEELKEEKEEAETVTEVEIEPEPEESEPEVEVKKEEKKSKPQISLSDRRKDKESELSKEDFEAQAMKKFEKEKEKEVALTPESDIKDTKLSPKLISILKAYGYKNIKSLIDAGEKKVNKIDELSPKDIKKVRDLIEKFKL